MKKIILTWLMVGATMVAEESTLDKFGALVMPIHQESDEHFVNIPHNRIYLLRKKFAKRVINALSFHIIH